MKTTGVLLMGIVLNAGLTTAILPVFAEWDTSHDDAYRRGKQQTDREFRDGATGFGSSPSTGTAKTNPC